MMWMKAKELSTVARLLGGWLHGVRAALHSLESNHPATLRIHVDRF